MKKYMMLKFGMVSMVIVCLAILSCFQNASAESLNGYTANGTASTNVTTFNTVTSVNVSTAVTVGDPILVVVTFMSESTGTLTIQKDPEFNLTDGTTAYTISRSLQGVTGGDADKGIGSIVNIYPAVSTTPTYSFQHRVSTAGRNIQTKATIVAIPLHSSPNNKILASASARAAGPSAAPAAVTAVANTTIAVGTTALGYGASPGAYYVAASVETYSTSISGTGNKGQWQLQYSSNGGGAWNDLGYPVQRTVKTANQYGISNLVGLLPNRTPGGTDYQFRLVHQKISGATDIYTANVNIVAVFTGINVSGTPLQFPTHGVNASTVETNSTTPVEAIGFDYKPKAASTRLFMHAQYWMTSNGKDTAFYDLYLNPNPTFTPQQLDRYLPAGSTGNGGSVGLASALSSATTYRVSLRHSHDATGQTLNTQNPWMVAMDLDTGAPAPDLAVSKACEELIPGQDDALVYTITIANVGSDLSPVSTLSDTIPAGVPGGADLTNIRYTIDEGIPPASGTAWPATNIIPLPSIAAGDSITVRIYADVPYTLTSIGNNMATVTLAADSVPGNNTSNTCSNSITTAPTSTRALELDPTDSTADDHVAVADAGSLDLGTGNTGTLESWIYVYGFGTAGGAGIIHKGDATDEAYSLQFGFGTQNDQIQLVVNDGTTADTLTSGTDLNLYEWYHVAGTWDGSDMAIFIDGIQDTTKSSTTDAQNLGTDLLIGAQSSSGDNPFYGIIDEVRVWNIARPMELAGADNDIRDYMCRKYVPTLATDPNLVCYLRFDETFGPICGDTSGNGNIGIINNAVRICSDAPIGDTSGHDYDATGGYTVTLGSTNTITITDDSAAGTWTNALKSGLQVYRVDNVPEPANGPLGSKIFPTRGYWGVFVTGGDSPTYAATYTYTEGGIGDEAELELLYRHRNCEPWKNIIATLDANANTLTFPGLSGTEFILGANVDPRNAISFDSTANNFISVADNATLQLTNFGAIEAWIYLSATPTLSAGIITKGNATNGYDLSTDGVTGTKIIFTLYNGGVSDTLTTGASATTLSTQTWYHIAATWDQTNMNLYVNGVLDTNSKASAQTSGSTAGNPLTIGYNNTAYFDGIIDEVRVWNISAIANMRTQTLIRDTMCQKLTGSETDLGGYWRFDEETGSITCPDYSGNGNSGTMTNMGADGSDAIRTARVCSSAPVGDDSAYDYFDLGAGVSIQLPHPDGDYMFATENGGAWNGTFSGIQLYRVDEVPVYPPDLWVTPSPYYSYQTPNGLTPPDPDAVPDSGDEWSSIDYYRYWGVFLTDPTAGLTYDLVYNYNGNPSVPVDDTHLGLAKRPVYCFGTWSDSGATLNAGADTLTTTSPAQNGPPNNTYDEYVLGGKDLPLAITLESFTAEAENDCIEIKWTTATEVDSTGFQLWRSESEDGPYAIVAGSLTASTSVTETQGAAYAYTDCDVALNNNQTTYYYKLEEIDTDTQNTNPLYGPIGPVTETVSASLSTRKQTSASASCFIDSIR